MQLFTLILKVSPVRPWNNCILMPIFLLLLLVVLLTSPPPKYPPPPPETKSEVSTQQTLMYTYTCVCIQTCAIYFIVCKCLRHKWLIIKSKSVENCRYRKRSAETRKWENGKRKNSETRRQWRSYDGNSWSRLRSISVCHTPENIGVRTVSRTLYGLNRSKCTCSNVQWTF